MHNRDKSWEYTTNNVRQREYNENTWMNTV